ncbi:MAG TPA: YIP1 family protein [Acidobacteriota bacterium]|nr:YIP1 family protein [Acidobacteriota bacterium]
MSLVKRIEGVFFNPKPTFDGLAAKPVWVDALVVVLLALIAFMAIARPYMQKDQLSLMKDNVVLKEKMGEANYSKMIERTEHPTTASKVIQIFVTTPLFAVAALLLQSLILFMLGRLASTQGTFVQVLSALVHASLVDKLAGNAVRLVLALTRGSVMQTSTSLALLFPKLEVTSTLYVALTQVDFFQLWMFGILAFGLAAVFKIKVQKALALSYTIWFFKALINIAIGLFGMSFLR